MFRYLIGRGQIPLSISNSCEVLTHRQWCGWGSFLKILSSAPFGMFLFGLLTERDSRFTFEPDSLFLATTNLLLVLF